MMGGVVDGIECCGVAAQGYEDFPDTTVQCGYGSRMHPCARTVSGRKDISIFLVSTCSTFEFTMSDENKKRYGRIFANLAWQAHF